MSVWTYTPGGTKLGDRITAMKPYMYEAGFQKLWNELATFMLRTVGSTFTTAMGARTQWAELDLGLATDVTTAVPRNFVDPFLGRQMPGYQTGTPQQLLFDGFSA